MAAEIVVVGYRCQWCGNRVTVMRSSNPPEKCPSDITAQCKCGHTRQISIDEIQSLEVWKEKPKSA